MFAGADTAEDIGKTWVQVNPTGQAVACDDTVMDEPAATALVVATLVATPLTFEFENRADDEVATVTEDDARLEVRYG